MGITFALLAGLLMSVQGVFNTRVMESSSMWSANIWIQLSALIVTIIIWLAFDTKNIFSVFSVSNKLYLLGGVIGAIITFTVIKSIGKLGPAEATMLILIAQVTVAYAIEFFALFGTDKGTFEISKLIGLIIMIAGIIIFKK